MALYAPPKHTIEAAAGLTSVYILPGDPAWDQNRITRELEDHFAETVDGKKVVHHDRHPVAEYLNGVTRYDLDAESVVGGERVTPRQYLIGKATEFRIRRLNTIDVARINGWMQSSRSNTELAMDYAVRRGLVEVTNLDITWRSRDGELSDETMSGLYDCGTSPDGGGGLPMIVDIGLAIWKISQPLSYAEKKA